MGSVSGCWSSRFGASVWGSRGQPLVSSGAIALESKARRHLVHWSRYVFRNTHLNRGRVQSCRSPMYQFDLGDNEHTVSDRYVDLLTWIELEEVIVGSLSENAISASSLGRLKHPANSPEHHQGRPNGPRHRSTRRPKVAWKLEEKGQK